MSKKLRDEFIDNFFKAILMLENEEECYQFFRDIATISELKALGQRLEVARMLEEGLTYEKIVETTGVSTATISRVKRSLDYGEDGYTLILKRMRIAED